MAKKSEITIGQVVDEVEKVTGEKRSDEDSFRASVILLSLAFVGISTKALNKFTGYPKPFIEQVKYRLKRSGVIRENKVYANWFDKGGGLEFCVDSAIARGLLERSC